MVYRFTSAIHTEGKRTFIEIPWRILSEKLMALLQFPAKTGCADNTVFPCWQLCRFRR